MNTTLEYYATYADEYIASTVDVDMSALREMFQRWLPANARVLDAGCGAGRDALAFAKAGYRVSAFDAVPEMVEFASKHTGLSVECTTFQKMTAVQSYEGIWACASLLHVPMSEMADVFARLARALVSGGILYCSFKAGEGESERNGRIFTCLTEDALRGFVVEQGMFQIKEIWLSMDTRPGREDEKWVNAILKKIECKSL